MVSLSTKFLLFSKIILFLLTSLFLLAIPKVGYSMILLFLIVNLAFFLGDTFLGKPFIYIKKGFLYKVSYLKIQRLSKLKKDYKIINKRNHFELFIDDKFCCSIYDFQYYWLIPVFLDKRKKRLNKKIKKSLVTPSDGASLSE